MDKVLIICAHGDDEVLGMGGTIARHHKNGDEIKLIILADGESARGEGDISGRKQMSEDAGKILGIQSIEFFDFPDNKMDSVPLIEIVKKIESIAQSFAPTIVYTHYKNDLNIDHEVSHRATMTAFRSLPGSSVRKLYAYEVLSSTEWSMGDSTFNPNHFVNIENVMDTKMKALKIYDNEMRESPHTRSYENVEALATFRGHCVGYRKAEAFELIRSLND